MTDLPEHEDSGLLREVDLLDDCSSCSVRHFALIPVGPEYATVDVSPTKRSRDMLSSHVLASQSPCYTPSSPDRPEIGITCVFPFTGLSPCDEARSSLFGGLFFVRFRSTFTQSVPHKVNLSDIGF